MSGNKATLASTKNSSPRITSKSSNCMIKSKSKSNSRDRFYLGVHCLDLTWTLAHFQTKFLDHTISNKIVGSTSIKHSFNAIPVHLHLNIRQPMSQQIMGLLPIIQQPTQCLNKHFEMFGPILSYPPLANTTHTTCSHVAHIK